MDSHVMIDLETLDNVPTSAIVSIGAVVFKGDMEGETFYVAVDKDSSIASGGTVSVETLDWWDNQSKEAKSVFSDPSKVCLKEALCKFSRWMSKLNNPRVWGNGASFDNAILSCSYRRVGEELPWKWWNDRCYRTVVANKPKRIQKGTHHNALDDAISQAEHLLLVSPEHVV